MPGTDTLITKGLGEPPVESRCKPLHFLGKLLVQSDPGIQFHREPPHDVADGNWKRIRTASQPHDNLAHYRTDNFCPGIELTAALIATRFGFAGRPAPNLHTGGLNRTQGRRAFPASAATS